MTDTLDDFLAHYGVPGMKWGKRKAQAKSERKEARRQNDARLQSDIAKAKAKGDRSLVTGAKISARYNKEHARINEKYGKNLNSAKKAVAKEKVQGDNDIINARLRQEKRRAELNVIAGSSYAQTTKAGLTAATKAYEKAEKEYVNNPDAAMSAKRTRGENAADNITLAVGGIALAAMLGSAVLSSRR